MKEKVEIIKKPTAGGWKAFDASKVKKSAWVSFLESVATVVFGVLLIVLSGSIVRAIAYVVGGFLIVSGAYRVISYLMAKEQNNFFNNTLIWGIISLLLGIVIFCLGDEIASVFRIIIGVWVIYEGIIRLSNAIKMNAANVQAWRWMLLVSILMLLFGVFITFTEGAFIELIGWFLVVTGLIGVFSDVLFMQSLEAMIGHTFNQKKKGSEEK